MAAVLLGGSNGDAARRWERYALALLSTLCGVLALLFWTMQAEVTSLRRVSDQRTAAVEKLSEHSEWIASQRVLLQEWAIRLAVMEKQIMQGVERTNRHAGMLQQLYRREAPLPHPFHPEGTEDDRR